MRSRPLHMIVLPVTLSLVGLAWADVVGAGHQEYQRYEWRASTFDLSAQHQADLAVAPDGRVIAVWSSRRQQAGRAGVFAQRFGPDGVARGAETPVGLWTKTHQTTPAIAVDRLGGSWCAWTAHGQDGYGGAIIARRFDCEFRGGDEIAVNQQTRGHQAEPVLAVSPDGVAAVVWTSRLPGQQATRLRGRLFGSDGQALTDEFAVGESDERTELVPSVAFAADGSWIVAFSVFDEKMEPAGIRGRRFDSAGKRLGEEINVSGPLRNSQIEPVIAATPDGFVVAWLDAESDGDDYGVLARRLDRAGNPLGLPFVVNTTRKGPQNGAAVAVAPDGGFAIAWNSGDGSESGVFARLYDADGKPRGGEFRVNGHTEGKQELHAARGTSRLAFDSRGGLLCAWSGEAGLGDKSSVNVTMLAARPLELAGREQGVTARMRPAAFARAGATGAEPHQPPTFDPKLIDHGERQIRRDAPSGFDAILNTGWTPPDPHLAVGPNHLVFMTNGAIAFAEKDGTQTFQDELEGAGGFWGSVGASDFVFDPEALYDEISGRFFVMAAEGYAPPNETRSYVLVAVSDDSDPNGTWHKYRFDTTGLCGKLFDSPNIAVDDEVVYITGDGFGYGAVYPVYTFDKASLLAGLPPAIQRVTTLTTSAMSAGLPPVSYDDPPALYMIEHTESLWTNNSVRLIALRDPLGSPYFDEFSLAVPTYRGPEDPPQKGSSVRPIAFDARFWSVAYRNGSLWATHHVNSSRVRARWYEIAMNGWPESGLDPELVQSGEIDPGGDVRTYFTAISVNARGDAAITCARSSPSEYISMITAVRYVTDPLGTFRAPVTHKVNTGPYGYERWGDYAGVNADPRKLNAFWAHHEYAVGSSWNTWGAPLRLTWGDLNCDDEIDFGDINPFVLRLSNPAQYAAQYPSCPDENADINGDGLVDFADINPFVTLLAN